MKNGFIFSLSILFSTLCPAQDLARVPRIWEEPAPHRLTKDEYEATLKFWDHKFGEMLTVERSGESAGGDGIYTIRITDPDTPDSE